MINKLILCFLLLLIGLNSSSQTDLEEFSNMSNYIKKGSWLAGGTVSLKFNNTQDKDQLIRYVDENEGYDFLIRADGAYAFADYNFAGLALQYGQEDRSGVFENSDGELFTEDFFGTRYSITPFLKNLTPIDRKSRFNIITQIEFMNQIDQGIKQTVLNEEITRTRTVKYTGLLGIRPGISVFVLRNVAFETTLNVAGIQYSYEKMETTNLPDAITETGSIDFRIDILQLNIGIFVYLWPKN
ncbi:MULTISPECIES: hypothetical protein [unclassified Carboxylicivirga]|uniref:hypothetical protein n=1 Tax=Carboxylicivirga TaxID=1628153 RepID=UPI003D33A733